VTLNTPKCIAAVSFAMMMAATANAASPLRISMSADIRSTEPGVNRDGNSDTVVQHMVEGLVAFGENGEVKPLLAKSVDISPDGKTYTFTLRDNVKFHNGAVLTSADVLWTWNFYMDPKTSWRCMTDFDGRDGVRVKEVTAPDPKTVVFQLDKPDGLFLGSLARVDCGGTGILHRDSLNADGSWNRPVGTGPFKLKEWRRGEYISLARFEDYSNRSGPQGGKRDGFTGSKRPLVDEVRFVVIPDDPTIKLALQRNDIDIVSDLSPTDVPVFEAIKGVNVAHADAMSMTTLLLQTRDPVLADPKLREAIAHAIDYVQLADAVNEKLAPANNSVVPVASAYYTDAQKKGWGYDPALAQKLLKESAYKGQVISLIASQRYPETYTAAVMMQAMLQSVGINARLDVMEWAALSDRYLTGKYQMISHPYSARMDPAQGYDAVTGNKDKQPRKIWDNPQAIELIDVASLETDHAKRQAIFDQLHQMFLKDIPTIPLYNGADIGAFRDGIVGYTPWSVRRPRAWEVTKAGQ
jgi:peptide/nickel transport system substrate-binding protein